jgi:hypothetical protein
MLTTPAMASEPYCAAAPSRRISMRSMALGGMAFRSTAVEPRPTVPLTLTSALPCRRLPLSSTSSWSGARPRSVAGRTWSVPSAMVARGKFTEGASRWMICAVSVSPVCWISSEVTTSTGTGALSTERSGRREPTTTSASMSIPAPASTRKSRVAACPAATATVARPRTAPTRLATSE